MSPSSSRQRCMPAWSGQWRVSDQEVRSEVVVEGRLNRQEVRTEQVVGLYFRITLLSSCSNTGQNESRAEDKHKSGHTTGEEEVCWSRLELIGYFASKIITDKLFTGGTIGYLSTERMALALWTMAVTRRFAAEYIFSKQLKQYLTTAFQLDTGAAWRHVTPRGSPDTTGALRTLRRHTGACLSSTTRRDESS